MNSNIPKRSSMIKSNYQRRPFIMANKKRNVYKPKPMTEGKKNLIQGLLQEYDIESGEDIQDALKDLLSGTIEGMVSDITDKLLPQIEEWQNRPLSDVYPIVFIDAIHFSVRDDGIIRKLAAYVVLDINKDGYKEAMTIEVGENESSKYWLSIPNRLKNRGVKDILLLCLDVLTGLKDMLLTRIWRLLKIIWRQSILPRTRKPPEAVWKMLQINENPNTQTPWNDGTRTGMSLLPFSSFQRRSGHFTPQMP